MQNKGIVKFVAVALVLVCVFYLSFSFVTRYYTNKAAAMSEEAGQEYLDSIMNEKVYLGMYSLKQCREIIAAQDSKPRRTTRRTAARKSK